MDAEANGDVANALRTALPAQGKVAEGNNNAGLLAFFLCAGPSGVRIHLLS